MPDVASTLAESEAFFQQHGYYPTTYAAPRIRVSTDSTPGKAPLRGGIALKGWRSPLHWTVPPLFEKPGRAMMEIGVEEFKEAVKAYWAEVGRLGVEHAQELYSRWVVRQCLRTFETQVRGFRKQEVSRRGGIFVTSSDELTLPEDLASKDKWGQENGRLLADLRRHLRAYLVPESRWEACEKLVRLRLGQKWGVKC